MFVGAEASRFRPTLSRVRANAVPVARGALSPGLPRQNGRPHRGRLQVSKAHCCRGLSFGPVRRRGRGGRRRGEEALGRVARLAGVVAGQHGRERVAGLGERGEKRHRGTEFQVVRRAQDLLGRAVVDAEQGGGAIPQAGSKDRMRQVGGRLRPRGDRVATGGRARAQAGHLGKHKPHPVRAFAAGAQLGERLRVDRRLGIEETLEWMRGIGGGGGHGPQVGRAGRGAQIRGGAVPPHAGLCRQGKPPQSGA